MSLQELRKVGRQLQNVRVGDVDAYRRLRYDMQILNASLVRVHDEQRHLEKLIEALGMWGRKNPKKWIRYMNKLNGSRCEQIRLEARVPA